MPVSSFLNGLSLDHLLALLKIQIILIFGVLLSAPVKADDLVVWGSIIIDSRGFEPKGVGVAAGVNNSLVFRGDGVVHAWGDNSEGQLSEINNTAGIVDASFSRSHSVVVTENGTVFAWGDNGDGQTDVPEGLSGVISVAAGSDHTIALRSDGTVVAWGSNNWGQTAVPADLDKVVSIAAGGSYNLALRENGEVIAWGSDFDGAAVPNELGDVIAVATDGFFSLALRSDGTVVGWGGSLFFYSLDVPPDLEGVVAIEVGFGWALALKDDGSLIGWGAIDQAKLQNLSGVTAIALGWDHGLAMKEGGEIVSLPKVHDVGTSRGADLLPSEWREFKSIAARDDSLFGITDSNNVRAVTTSSHTNAPIPQGLDNVISLGVGKDHTLALRSDGSVVAWGDDDYGKATVPDGLSGVAGVAAGQEHSIALKDDGSLVIWGEDGNLDIPEGLGETLIAEATSINSIAVDEVGQILVWGGDNPALESVPQGLTGVSAVSGGLFHAVALLGDGTVHAWGLNPYGETEVPEGLDEVVAVSAGWYRSVALRDDGSVVVWGRVLPNDISDELVDVTAIAAGHDFFAALVSDEVVRYKLEAASGAPGEFVEVENDGVVGLGEIALGSELTKEFRLTNEGDVAISGFDVMFDGFDGNALEVSGKFAQSLPPGKSVTFTIRFMPRNTESYSEELLVSSLNEDGPEYRIRVEASSRNDELVSREAMLAYPGGRDFTNSGYSVALLEEHLVMGSQADAWDVATVPFSRGESDRGRIDVDALELLPFPFVPGDFVYGDFGSAVATSGDWVVAGARTSDIKKQVLISFPFLFETVTYYDAGIVHVWRQQGGERLDRQLIRGPNTEGGTVRNLIPPSGDRFGHSVDIAGDWLIVGAPWEDGAGAGVDGSFSLLDFNDDDSAEGRGAAYIFEFVDGQWIFHSYLKPSDPHVPGLPYFLNFGHSVAIDGDIAIVGSPGSTDREGVEGWVVEYPGAAYVFRRTGDTWAFEERLTASNAEVDDSFGVSVDIEGVRCVVGAHREDSVASNSGGEQDDNSARDRGAVYVFDRDGTDWRQSAYLKGPASGNVDFGWGQQLDDPFRAAGPSFGASVSLSGSRLLVGCPREIFNGGGMNDDPGFVGPFVPGAAYLFELEGEAWQLVHLLRSREPEEFARFGHSVAMKDDLMLVGSPGKDGRSGDVEVRELGMAELFETYTPSFGEARLRHLAKDAGLAANVTRPMETPFSDGVSNLFKYAFNLDFSGPDSEVLTSESERGLPWSRVVEGEGAAPDVFRIEYLRRRNSGLTYSAEISTDLGEVSFGPTTGPETVVPIGDGWERVSVDETIVPGADLRVFSRVRVEFED